MWIILISQNLTDSIGSWIADMENQNGDTVIMLNVRYQALTKPVLFIQASTYT